MLFFFEATSEKDCSWKMYKSDGDSEKYKKMDLEGSLFCTKCEGDRNIKCIRHDSTSEEESQAETNTGNQNKSIYICSYVLS